MLEDAGGGGCGRGRGLFQCTFSAFSWRGNHEKPPDNQLLGREINLKHLYCEGGILPLTVVLFLLR